CFALGIEKSPARHDVNGDAKATHSLSSLGAGGGGAAAGGVADEAGGLVGGFVDSDCGGTRGGRLGVGRPERLPRSKRSWRSLRWAPRSESVVRSRSLRFPSARRRRRRRRRAGASSSTSALFADWTPMAGVRRREGDGIAAASSSSGSSWK